MDKIEELRESLVLNDVAEEEIKDKFDKIIIFKIIFRKVAKFFKFNRIYDP